MTTADAVINGVTVGLGGNSDSTNIAFGLSALQSNLPGGFQNTAVGFQSLLLNYTGSYNTAI